jgi:glycosyltransferase involved in cell wall biosynthesis
MKIGLVSTYAWPLVGGLEKLGLRLGQQLQASGDHSLLVARFSRQRHGLADYFRASERGGFFDNEGLTTWLLPLCWWERILWLPLFKLIWRQRTFPFACALYNLVMVPKLQRILKGCDAVHFLGCGPEMLGFACAAVAHRLGIPFLVEPALHPGQWGDSWIDERLYREAHRVLAHTQSERLVLINLGIRAERVSVVLHGVDHQEGGDGQRFRERFAISPTTPLILFLGRKTREKGVFRLVEAFHNVRRCMPEALLVLAGPAGGAMTREQQTGVLDLNDLSEAQKQDVLAACSLLCVPSEGESFGLVYYEAWFHRKAVVALDLPALRESVRANQAGLLISENPSSLENALLTLLQNPEQAKEMGERGRALAMKHSWISAIKSYREAYAETLISFSPSRGSHGASLQDSNNDLTCQPR